MSLSGNFVLDSNENLEGFLGKLGVSAERISVLAAAKPSMSINLEGSSLKLVSSAGDKKTENVLTIGKPSTFKLFSGAEFEVTLQPPSDNVAKGNFKFKESTGDLIIEFGGGKLVETFNFGGISCKRIYKRQ